MIIKPFIRFCGIIPLICFNSSFLLEGFRDFQAPTCFSFCLFKAFPKVEYANLVSSIICLPLEGSISSPVRYSYLSIFPDENANTFAASLLISYCSFSSLMLSAVVVISLCIFSKNFFLKHKELSEQE